MSRKPSCFTERKLVHVKSLVKYAKLHRVIKCSHRRIIWQSNMFTGAGARGSDRLCVAFVLVTIRSSPVVDMMLHRDHSSAWRRRQRRLRSWWRHEQQSVAMALFRSRPPKSSPGAGALPVVWRCAARVCHGPCAAGSGCSGTPWSTGSRRAPSCRSRILRCRRGETSLWWRRSSICLFPSR